MLFFTIFTNLQFLQTLREFRKALKPNTRRELPFLVTRLCFCFGFLKFFLIFSFVYSHVPSVTPLSLYPGVTTKKNKIYKTLDNRVQTPPTTGRRGDRVVTSIPGGIRSGITGNLVVDLYTIVSKIPRFILTWFHSLSR